MKKLLTLITFTTAFVPTVYGMESNVATNAQTNTQEVHSELVTFIQTADSENFKNKFDTLTLTAEHKTVLRQIIAETKAVIAKEIEAMGENNKNWLEIAKGGLTGLYGLSNALIPIISIFLHMSEVQEDELPSLLRIPATLAWSTTSYPTQQLLLNTKPANSLFQLIKDNIYKVRKINQKRTISLILLPTLIAYKTLSYAAKKLKLGFNYKEHLQTMLANLDIIDNHIAQAKI